MKKIGIVGGLGPESTLDYYKRIIAKFQADQHAQAYPEIILYSADIHRLMPIFEARQWDDLTGCLADYVRALHRAGADFAVIASNTPHVVFDAVSAGAPIPMLSIVEETCRHVRRAGLKRPGLLGTRFTMQADFYPALFAKNGLDLVMPDLPDQELIHQRLFSEIELGIFKESTRRELLAIIHNLQTQRQVDSIILGCTELPLILTRDQEFGMPLLNTTAIHVDAIVRYCQTQESG